MKLRTSLFNTTVLKKDITRFAPVWGLYTIFMLLFVFLAWESETLAARFAVNAPVIMCLMGAVNLCYAGLCAVLLFGDLFKSRMCNALHAMPLRREGWFLTHLAAGMLFCIVPNTLGALVAAALLQEYCYLAFLWLGLMVLQYLFFFGVGAFSVMCAGNTLGCVALYGIINFLSMLVFWLVKVFYEPFLFGITLSGDGFMQWCPVVMFCSTRYVDIAYDNMEELAQFKGFVPGAWEYLLVAAGAGLLFLGLAVLIYRKRKLENAGDFMAVKPAKPVFLVIFTLCAGALMYFAANLVSETARYFFMVIGFAVGFFTGRMLLEKKVHVFQKKTFLAFGAFAVAFALSMALTWLDPAGVTKYIPEADQVAQVSISPYATDYYVQNQGVTLTEQADIEVITQLHGKALRQRRLHGEMPLNICYKMKNGTVVERQYYLGPGEEWEVLRSYYSSPMAIFKTEDVDTLLETAYLLEVYSHTTKLPHVGIAINDSVLDVEDFKEKFGEDGECLTYLLGEEFENSQLVKGLIEAVLADCRAGNMAQLWQFHAEDDSLGFVQLHYFVPRGSGSSAHTQTRTLEFTIYENCSNTIAYLQQLEK